MIRATGAGSTVEVGSRESFGFDWKDKVCVGSFVGFW
jgi:hypothetical protein